MFKAREKIDLPSSFGGRVRVVVPVAGGCARNSPLRVRLQRPALGGLLAPRPN